jgi:hypothetical protein
VPTPLQVAYRIAKRKKKKLTPLEKFRGYLPLFEIVETMLGETMSSAVSLADDTVGRRIMNISEDLCDQLIGQL